MTTAFILIPLATICLILLAIWGTVLWGFIAERDDAVFWALVAAAVTTGAGAFIWTCVDAGVISP